MRVSKRFSETVDKSFTETIHIVSFQQKDTQSVVPCMQNMKQLNGTQSKDFRHGGQREMNL